jgi:hypothetical protein
MRNFGSEIDEALRTDGPIQREKVLHWIDGASDLPTLSKLYRITGEGYYRIQPELGMEAECDAVQRYLFECIRQNVTDDDEIEDRWEAAGTLHSWFCHLGEMKDTSTVLTKATQAITKLFLEGGEDVQIAIEQGFLEHALEMEHLRPLFDHWSSDDRLRGAWERATEWGKAHPAFMWGLIQQLPKPEK